MEQIRLIPQKAFALLEAIAIAVLVAIIAAIALPRIGGKDFSSQLTLKITAQQIASDARYTRRLAITNGIKHIINFDKQKKYGIYRDRVNPQCLIGELKQVPDVIKMYPPTGDQFVFEKFGEASISGTLTLKTGPSEKYQYDINVNPVTGAVKTEKIS